MARQALSAIEQIQEKFQQLKETLADVGVADVVRNKWDELRSGATRSYATGREKALALEEGLEHKVREHPMRWVLISVGVGLLVGSLLKSRR